MLFPPANYGVVEEGLYRGAIPTEINVPFLETLRLKTVVLLEHVTGAEEVDAMWAAYLEENGIELVRIGEEADRQLALGSLSATKSSQPMSEELVLRALHVVVDASKYPLMVVDLLGKHRSGVLLACLRKLQRWNLTSVFEEYRRFASGKRRLQNEQFIELFDVDLVCVPPHSPAFLQFGQPETFEAGQSRMPLSPGLESTDDEPQRKAPI
mmetsp:Transcript_31852/g.71689  ORF Transcript_31852/g.71689 Transcript_31852/m.71689 type:complete len:211 (+) Transcript_31852:294-926(+)|eukprot:CAMPEP_0172603268 /NCGR_PEP_ID=MMETSP1068-20121228/23493_1 /TAXON_ID=35684 /ORGANISM="Pseudopedinella elastica, Strain CCMP716" /LENGTH=210 /DNA_ID=CAMNT_0013404941 /DNA_START=217 /DNA_END=849 /DNA_ORIENTATION=-